ncbi:MAG: hypothetical protein F4Y72_01580 [Gammaproteobacteria bacterium]|nr:hypothetical protein [Gammaproteobacteria bacterium]
MVSLILGSLLTITIQLIRNKRGLFSYSVQHERIGISGSDNSLGSVAVTWNDTPVPRLYVSTVELKNASLKDYENVLVRVFTNDAHLLNETTYMVDTTRAIHWTSEFAQFIRVEPGSEPTVEQKERYFKQRDYLVPTMNRGQIVRLTFLTVPATDQNPNLWLDIVHTGAKLKFQARQEEFLGIPQRSTALAGAALSLIFYLFAIWLIDSVWVAAGLCLLFGLLAAIPGALLLKLFRLIRSWVGD